jgi:hypothetical protein
MTHLSIVLSPGNRFSNQTRSHLLLSIYLSLSLFKLCSFIFVSHFWALILRLFYRICSSTFFAKWFFYYFYSYTVSPLWGKCGTHLYYIYKQHFIVHIQPNRLCPSYEAHVISDPHHIQLF